MNQSTTELLKSIKGQAEKADSDNPGAAFEAKAKLSRVLMANRKAIIAALELKERVDKADTSTVKENLTVQIAEYVPKGGPLVMIWVNQRRTDLGGYCIECVPRHVAPTIVSALQALKGQTDAK